MIDNIVNDIMKVAQVKLAELVKTAAPMPPSALPPLPIPGSTAAQGGTPIPQRTAPAPAPAPGRVTPGSTAPARARAAFQTIGVPQGPPAPQGRPQQQQQPQQQQRPQPKAAPQQQRPQPRAPQTQQLNIRSTGRSNYAPEQLAEFNRQHNSTFDPNSSMDRGKMRMQIQKSRAQTKAQSQQGSPWQDAKGLVNSAYNSVAAAGNNLSQRYDAAQAPAPQQQAQQIPQTGNRFVDSMGPGQPVPPMQPPTAAPAPRQAPAQQPPAPAPAVTQQTPQQIQPPLPTGNRFVDRSVANQRLELNTDPGQYGPTRGAAEDGWQIENAQPPAPLAPNLINNAYASMRPPRGERPI
jgi:hypothetical protein